MVLLITLTFSGSVGSIAISADSDQQLIFITKTKSQKAFVDLLKVSKILSENFLFRHKGSRDPPTRILSTRWPSTGLLHNPGS